ncbi:MAG: hypothetical protein CMQ05_01795 [Gammaproteobacteria bacterium]|nr:hypothetical protein [Gammaproteobacteria bacterium]RPG26617.1 MAG: hypothetical protein CBC10_003585 [Gammaproteobacteria bacterium TMED50]
MHDGITFEQLGKRAVVLCTEPFEITAKNIARVMGMPDYPFVILDHPLGSCTIEEIRDRAQVAADAAVEILTT